MAGGGQLRASGAACVLQAGVRALLYVSVCRCMCLRTTKQNASSTILVTSQFISIGQILIFPSLLRELRFM